jgi:hypothetical protein
VGICGNWESKRQHGGRGTGPGCVVTRYDEVLKLQKSGPFEVPMNLKKQN